MAVYLTASSLSLSAASARIACVRCRACAPAASHDVYLSASSRSLSMQAHTHIRSPASGARTAAAAPLFARPPAARRPETPRAPPAAAPGATPPTPCCKHARARHTPLAAGGGGGPTRAWTRAVPRACACLSRPSCSGSTRATRPPSASTRVWQLGHARVAARSLLPQGCVPRCPPSLLPRSAQLTHAHCVAAVAVRVAAAPKRPTTGE